MPSLSSLQTKSAVSVPNSERELLAEFAPERDADGSSASVDEGIARGWMLVAAVALVAVFAIGAMFAYLRVQALSELPTITVPPPPLRTVQRFSRAFAGFSLAHVNRDQAGPRASIERTGDERFAIQVASFETLPRAERLVAELTDAGYRARAVELDLGPERGRIVQVLVGGYRTAEDAGPDLAHHARPFPTSPMPNSRPLLVWPSGEPRFRLRVRKSGPVRTRDSDLSQISTRQ